MRTLKNIPGPCPAICQAVPLFCRFVDLVIHLWTLLSNLRTLPSWIEIS